MKNFLIIITIVFGFTSCSLVPLRFHDSSTELSTVFEESLANNQVDQHLSNEIEIEGENNNTDKKGEEKSNNVVLVVTTVVVGIVVLFGIAIYNAIQNSQ